MEEDNLTVALHRPEQVLMRFFDNNTEYLGGSMVKLGHRLSMRLEVPNNEDGMSLKYTKEMISKYDIWFVLLWEVNCCCR